MFTKVVSWRRHYIRALQVESKGLLPVLQSCGSDASVMGLCVEGQDWCSSVAPGTYLILPSLSAPLGTAKRCMPAPCLLMRKAGALRC